MSGAERKTPSRKRRFSVHNISAAMQRKINHLRGAKGRLMADIAENSLRFFRDKVFEAEGFIDAGVDRWKPTKKKTSGKILQKTGRLRHSARKISTPTRAQVMFGSPYFRFHNEGTPRMPQRKILGPSERLFRENQVIFRNFMRYR